MSGTIFMIHGMWGRAWCWENLLGFFESHGYHCVATTLRHHDMDPGGDPDPALGITSILDYLQDLEEEIRQLTEPPIIMGHSMGGLLAQMLGARGLAKALVLLTPAPPAGINALRPSVIRSFWSVITSRGFWRRPMRLPFAAAVYSMLHLLPPEEQRAVYDRFVFESGRAAFEIGFWLLDRGGAARVDERQLSCPTLVVGAAHDRITPVAVVRGVARKYRAVSTYLELPDNAHWVLGEPGWQQMAGRIHDWLGSYAP